MNNTAVIKNITIYPVKSLDGISLQKARFGPGGCLLHDREYAIVDANGKKVKGKSNVMVHLLRSRIDFENEMVSLKHETETAWNHFHLIKDKTLIDGFLSTFFKIPVTLQRDTAGRFLDEPVKSGVTILSTASLERVSSWFDNLSLEETRKRFRANIEITDVPAFWEDQLFYKEGTAVEFKIGDALLYGLSPRARCVVPARHPQTGETIQGFQKSFALQRAAGIPAWSLLNVYGHSYYLAVDCYIPSSEFGKWIEVGDEMKIIGKKDLNEISIPL